MADFAEQAKSHAEKLEKSLEVFSVTVEDINNIKPGNDLGLQGESSEE
jgi:hypothetical protein